MGSGLGLSMIYGFVRQSGGYLKINSEVGIGTTVRICLPRATGEDDPATREMPRTSLPTGHETILVVDDSPEMRQVAERHLRFLGYSVLTAEHGPAAVALLRAGTPVNLLFTDIAMPEGMNGFHSPKSRDNFVQGSRWYTPPAMLACRAGPAHRIGRTG